MPDEHWIETQIIFVDDGEYQIRIPKRVHERHSDEWKRFAPSMDIWIKKLCCFTSPALRVWLLRGRKRQLEKKLHMLIKDELIAVNCSITKSISIVLRVALK